ncbi:hypothetical protein CUR178_04785 [Leishmania enriettii]|uniref:Transmembrane protein n=1 Tax=Leishmania enriettii TaxID=5663 RepID=A0A836HS51_LEIEN|nr:hypothetical protein CUR178_04785 [Leishmania enriettii]
MGKLRREAPHTSSSEASLTADESPSQRPTRTSIFGWLRHIYKEENGVSGFLRGGKAERSFVLVTFLEEALLVAAMRRLMDSLGRSMPSQSGRTGDGGGVVGLTVMDSGTHARHKPSFMATARHADCDSSAPYGGYAPACLPVCKTSRHPVQHGPPQRRPRRYTSATVACGYIRPRMGIRGLLNGLDVDLASRAFSLGVVWTVVRPTSRWMLRVLMMSASTAGAAFASFAFVRRGQHRLCTLGVLMAVSGFVNALQRPFVARQECMVLLPATDAERVYNEGDDQAKTSATARRGCRYANGWDCAVQVRRCEGYHRLARWVAALPDNEPAGTAVTDFRWLPNCTIFLRCCCREEGQRRKGWKKEGRAFEPDVSDRKCAAIGALRISCCMATASFLVCSSVLYPHPSTPFFSARHDRGGHAGPAAQPCCALVALLHTKPRHARVRIGACAGKNKLFSFLHVYPTREQVESSAPARPLLTRLCSTTAMERRRAGQHPLTSFSPSLLHSLRRRLGSSVTLRLTATQPTHTRKQLTPDACKCRIADTVRRGPVTTSSPPHVSDDTAPAQTCPPAPQSTQPYTRAVCTTACGRPS